MHKKYLIIVLLILVIFSFSYQIYLHKDTYTTKYNYAYYTDRYVRSQYVLNEKYTNIINDYDLYSYAGYYYITGGEVSRVNFENPPLGKYLIGLSIILFQNQMIIYLIYGIGFLYLTYLFANKIFKNNVLSLLSVLILTLDPVFHQAINFPMLDFPMSLFFLIGLYFLILSNKWQNYLWGSFFWGLAFSTKFFPSLFLYAGFMILYHLLNQKKHFWHLMFSLTLIPIIYITTYSEFLLRNNFWEFIKYIWWVIKWRMNNPIVFGNGLRVMFTGTFKTWWVTKAVFHKYTAEWSLFIPIISILSLISIFIFWKNKTFRLVYFLVIITLVYINLATEGSLKYLTPIYPFLIIFSLSSTITIIKNYYFLIKNRFFKKI